VNYQGRFFCRKSSRSHVLSFNFSLNRAPMSPPPKSPPRFPPFHTHPNCLQQLGESVFFLPPVTFYGLDVPVRVKAGNHGGCHFHRVARPPRLNPAPHRSPFHGTFPLPYPLGGPFPPEIREPENFHPSHPYRSITPCFPGQVLTFPDAPSAQPTSHR